MFWFSDRTQHLMSGHYDKHCSDHVGQSVQVDHAEGGDDDCSSLQEHRHHCKVFLLNPGLTIILPDDCQCETADHSWSKAGVTGQHCSQCHVLCPGDQGGEVEERVHQPEQGQGELVVDTEEYCRIIFISQTNSSLDQTLQIVLNEQPIRDQ